MASLYFYFFKPCDPHQSFIVPDRLANYWIHETAWSCGKSIPEFYWRKSFRPEA